MGQRLLTVRGITKSFPGVKALKGVDLTVWPGEVHALVGENGAGKSTLMKILAGTQRPDGGEITLDGKPVHFHTPHQARAAGIGIIYQELSIAPNLTVAGNVFLGSEKRRLGFLTDTPGMVRETQQVLDRPGARFKAAHHGHGRANHGLVRPRNDRLFEVVRQLRSEGMAIIYISLEWPKSTAWRPSFGLQGRRICR